MYKTVIIKTNIYEPLYIDESFRLSFDIKDQIAINENIFDKLFTDNNVRRFIVGENKNNPLFKTDKNIETLEIIAYDIQDADMTIYTVYEKKYGKEYYRKPYIKEQEIEKLELQQIKLVDEVEEIQNDIDDLEQRKNDVEYEIEKIQQQIDELKKVGK